MAVIVPTTENKTDAREKTYQERLAFFQTWVANLPETKTEPLSDEAISRESIYAERLNRQR